MSKESVRAPRPWFRVEARAAADPVGETSSADVYIYDEIGESWWGGISPKALIDEITALDVDTLRVFINSPGGAAWDGIAIMNALRRHKARVEVTVDALAASAASLIAMAGDRIIMNRGSELMIHDASGLAYGNAETMEETAAILHKLSDSYADTYAARAGGDREQWRAAMQAETWYTAEEAVAAGLADEWVDAPAADASFDLSRFHFAGRAHAPAPRLVAEAHKLPSSSEPGDPNRKENAVAYSDLTAGLRERLGVTDANADDETLLSALDEALTERASETTTPEGTTLIDATVLADLQAAAEEGRKARAEQAKERRERIVDKAAKEGRISPASRATWLEQLEANEEGTVSLLASLAPNTVPVAEVGHSDEPDGDESLYASAWGNENKEG